MEITPVYLQDENDQHVLTGAVVMLRSTIRMGRQLQNVAAQDVSAFSQIVAVKPENEACCRTGAETGDAKRATADYG